MAVVAVAALRRVDAGNPDETINMLLFLLDRRDVVAAIIGCEPDMAARAKMKRTGRTPGTKDAGSGFPSRILA